MVRYEILPGKLLQFLSIHAWAQARHHEKKFSMFWKFPAKFLDEQRKKDFFLKKIVSWKTLKKKVSSDSKKTKVENKITKKRNRLFFFCFFFSLLGLAWKKNCAFRKKSRVLLTFLVFLSWKKSTRLQWQMSKYLSS